MFVCLACLTPIVITSQTLLATKNYLGIPQRYVSLRHVSLAYPKSWTAPWTLDSQNFIPPPKKNLSIPPPIKLPPPPKKFLPPNKVCEFSNKQRYSPPHPLPRKNLYVSPLKLPPPKTPPFPPPNKKYNYIGFLIEID